MHCQTGDWLQLNGWICANEANEVEFLPSALPTTATISSITTWQRSDWTEVKVIFPLDVPAPIALQGAIATLA